MDTLGELMIAVYVFLAMINVWAAANRRRIVFCITKSMLMLVLIGVYAVNSSLVLPQVVVALFFAWLGDVLLLPSGDKRMGKGVEWGLDKVISPVTLGGLAFIICHILYIWTFCQVRYPHNEWQPYVIIMLVYIISGKLFYTAFIRDFSGLADFMKLGIGIYVFVLLMMSFSSTLLIGTHGTYAVFPFIGSLFFIFSDYLIAIGYKTKKTFIYHPWIMASYLISQILISAGLVLLGF